MKCILKTDIATVKDKANSFQIGDNQFVVAEEIAAVADKWKEFAYADIFLSVPFLQAIESMAELKMKPFYVLHEIKGICVGVLYFQLRHFNLKSALPVESKEAKLNLKNWVSSFVDFDTLVLGNLLLTGNYGCCAVNPSSHKFDWKEFQVKMLQYLKVEKQIEPSAILAKDFYNNQVPLQLEAAGFHKFAVQPNMILHLAEDWHTFDDYLEAFKAKYRVRYRRALKKSEGLTFRALTLDDLEFYMDHMHDLYLGISATAVFNLFTLPPDYFFTLKQALGDRFLVYGYFDQDNTMMAFFSCVDNYDHLQAHFLGYNQEENHEKQIYLNMLYKIVEIGIAHHQKQIILSRTAIEIKTTVGAIPHEMSCLFLHTNSITNKLFGPIFSAFKPDDQFIIRSPFKDGLDQ
ncbi:MAG TPA: hypothetical protein PKD18_07305 [Saprospiraceae bacterium]|nr:hypothetical protein [Saprospiraceae bacterium]